jgi:hypothetical protein
MTAISEQFLPFKEIGIGRPKIFTIIINTSAFAPKLGIGIEADGTGIGISALSISVRYRSIPVVDWCALIPKRTVRHPEF